MSWIGHRFQQLHALGQGPIASSAAASCRTLPGGKPSFGGGRGPYWLCHICLALRLPPGAADDKRGTACPLGTRFTEFLITSRRAELVSLSLCADGCPIKSSPVSPASRLLACQYSPAFRYERGSTDSSPGHIRLPASPLAAHPKFGPQKSGRVQDPHLERLQAWQLPEVLQTPPGRRLVRQLGAVVWAG